MAASFPRALLALLLSSVVAACSPSPAAVVHPVEILNIGISAALTGPNAAVYAAIYDAINVYFQRVNDQGGINGRRVELLVEDDGGDATRAATNAAKLVQQQHVPILVLASPSASYGPVMSIAKAATTPLLIAGACPRETLPPSEPLVFCSASFGTPYDSAAAIRFVQSVSGSDVRLAMTGVDIPLSRMYVETGVEFAAQAGMQVVNRQIIPLVVTDFSPFAAQVAQSDANWVWANGPWGAEIGPFESLHKLGWNGNYLLWAHQPAEEEFRRRKLDSLYGITSNALFVEDLPIHREIKAAAEKYRATYPFEQLAEGWVTAMALEEALRTSEAPVGTAQVQTALNNLNVDTRGLRGTSLTFTTENHFRPRIAYRVYRWDSQQDRIVIARDWELVDVVAQAR